MIFKSVRSLWTSDKERCVKCVKFLFLKNNVTTLPTSKNILPNVGIKSKKKFTAKTYFLMMVPVTSFALGTWQIQRKQWKDQLIKNFTEITHLEPVELPSDLEKLKEMEYHPVKVRGRFDHTREFQMGPRSFINNKQVSSNSFSLISSPSKAGYWVITPFKLSDRDLTILVNRGWVPASKKSQETRLGGQVSDEVQIVGLVRHSEKTKRIGAQNIPERDIWMCRDLEMMSKVIGTSPILIDADVSSTIPEGPIGGQTLINIPNNHLSYIFTWYGLGIATSAMFYNRFIRIKGF